MNPDISFWQPFITISETTLTKTVSHHQPFARKNSNEELGILCLSYFSLVMRHHSQGHWKNEFIWADSVRGQSPWLPWQRSTAAGKGLAQWLTAHIFTHNPEAVRANGNAVGFFKFKAGSQWWYTPPPTKPHLLILPKQFHQLGTKCSHLSLWGHSSNPYITSIRHGE